MIFRTNSKIPPLQQNSRSHNFTLSIKSKSRPFMLSHSKPLQPQIESESESDSDQAKYFPVDVYKDMLKGEKIYLEMYYRDQLIDSGYEPYIEAMGGQIAKRVCPSTTIILTTIMTRQRYDKLKGKVQKICKPSTHILSIVWLQEIYRQKRKVEKEKFVFDQNTDIILDQNGSDDDDSMPDYFERQIFGIDQKNDWDKFFKNCESQLLFKVEDNKKFRDKLGEDFLDIIEPQTYELFSEFDQDQFKILKNRPGYKYIWPENKDKEKKKKRNRSSTAVGAKKTVPEKDKKPRVSVIKKPQKDKKQQRITQTLNRSDSFDDSLFKPDIRGLPEKPPLRRTIDKADIQNYQQQIPYMPTKQTSLKKISMRKNDDIKNQNYQISSKRVSDQAEKPSKKFTQMGSARPQKKQKNDKGSKTSDQDEQSQADFLKRLRQRKEGDESFETAWNKMISKGKLGSKKVTNTNVQEAPNHSVSLISESTPSKSQTSIAQRTITAPKNYSKFNEELRWK